jgi:hypothetical protein
MQFLQGAGKIAQSYYKYQYFTNILKGFFRNSRGKPPHFHPEGRWGRQANIREPDFE